MSFVATAIVIAVVASTGTMLYTASEEKKMQKKTLSAQEAAVAEAERKAKAAEQLAAQEGRERVKKFRYAQTQSVLTSPLGISEQAPVQRTILGSG